MIVLIDNYDSFSYNLYQLAGSINPDMKVIRNDEMTIDEICVHRTDVDLLWVEDSIEEWEQLIHESRHSYYPVCVKSGKEI